MKELTIEEKAKAYDKAIKKAKTLYENANGMILKKWVEQVFPELAESEDERIRKELIDFLRFINKNGFVDDFSELNYTLWIAWLEKQGEQKHTAEEVLIKAGLKPYKDGDQWCVLLGDNIQEGICGFGNTIEDALYAFLKDLIASQGEQKPVEPQQDILSQEQYSKAVDECIYGEKPVEWKQENVEELTDFENAMMHIGNSFFSANAGLDPNDTETVRSQANLLLELAQTPVLTDGG